MALHARLACPARSVQLVAAHFTSSLLLARRKPMEQLPAGAGAPAAACSAVGSVAAASSPVLHCSSRLLGSSRDAMALSAGSAQLQDFSREDGAKARLMEQVVAVPPLLAAQPVSLVQSAQPGPVVPSGQVAAAEKGRSRVLVTRPEYSTPTTLGSQPSRPGRPGAPTSMLTVLCKHQGCYKCRQEH